jgi:UDP-N-acetylglucosamine:LPS N-acetylglucosamine transferase
MQASNKILLCVSNTGGGHHSAANAIRDAIHEVVQGGSFGQNNFDVVITDVVEDSSVIHRLFVALYDYLLRYRQGWMKYYYNCIEFVKPDNCAIGYWLSSPYARNLLRSVDPAIVVSLHPMANHYLAHALHDLKLPKQPKLIEVVIDPNAQLWTGWACRDAYLITAPNDLARQRLISLGVESERIATVGMPINPHFLHPPLQSREEFLRSLGLRLNLVTVCLSAGCAGGGNFRKIYSALAEVQTPLQALVICGHNEDLYREIEQYALHMAFPTAVVRELPSLSDAMWACDLLVTKAGGLTTYEAVARRLPLAIDMLTEPMPQEVGTAEILIDAGLAKPIYHPSDIVGIVEALEHVENRDKLPLPTSHNLDRTDAVYEIAKIILSNCHIDKDTSKITVPTLRR